MILPLPDWATYVVAILTLLFGVGRLARVITYDDFPPSAAVRAAWDTITNDGPWSKLAHCFWCLTPWITLVAMGWWALGVAIEPFAWLWWIFWGWLALSYVASMIVARDEPADSPEVDAE